MQSDTFLFGRPRAIRCPRAGLLTIILMFFLINSAWAGPSGDYGDAPVGNNGDNIEAYPGVLSRFVSFYDHKNTVFSPMHDHGTWVNPSTTFYLGHISPTVKSDTQQDPSLPENDCYPLILLEGTAATPGPNPMSTLALDVTTTAAHNPSDTIFLNVFIDQNRDGQWKDGYSNGTPVIAWDLEWVVQDLAILQDADRTALHTSSYFRLKSPTQTVWLRIVLTDQRVGEMYRDHPVNGTGLWDATMPGAHSAVGEIEDWKLDYYLPADLPTNGIRGYGIVLRRLLQPNPPPGWPKAECFLNFKKVNYTRPLGEIRQFVILTPLCPGGVDFGLFFSTANVNGGCDGADGLVGIYGLKLVDGAGPAPIISANPAVVPGLAAPPLACPDGTNLTLPPVHPDGPPFNKISDGVAPVADIKAGTQYWNACYPLPKKYRRWSSRILAKACGSETYNHPITPGKDDPYDYTAPVSALEAPAGTSVRVDFVIDGDLIEKYFDDEIGVPFPDPNFLNFQWLLDSPTGFADLDGETFFSPPMAARFINGGYMVAPSVPEDMIPTEITFLSLGSEGTVIASSETSEPIIASFPPAADWTTFTMPLPSDFALSQVEVHMTNGWMDDLTIGLDLAPQTELSPIGDCNENGQSDDIDIEEGILSDANGNFIPDECEGSTPYTCGDSNGDSNVNVSDAVFIINYVFVGGDPPIPFEAGDANCDGTVNVSDAVYIINYVFVGGPAPCADCP